VFDSGYGGKGKSIVWYKWDHISE